MRLLQTGTIPTHQVNTQLNNLTRKRILTMKLNIFKSALFMAVAAVAFSSCSDEGYWDEFKAEGEQYSMLTTEVSRNYKRTKDSVQIAQKNPYFNYSIRRTDSSGDSYLSLTVTPDATSASAKEKAVGYFSYMDADSALTPLKDMYVDTPVLDAEGNPVMDDAGNPVTEKVISVPVKFDKGSYQSTLTLVYVGGYGSLIGTTKYTISFGDEFKSPGGKNTAKMIVACGSGKD